MPAMIIAFPSDRPLDIAFIDVSIIDISKSEKGYNNPIGAAVPMGFPFLRKFILFHTAAVIRYHVVIIFCFGYE